MLCEAPGWRPCDGRRARVQEDDQTKEAKQHQLLEEDIDAILARAEVRSPPHPTLPYRLLRLDCLPGLSLAVDVSCP